MARKMKGRKTVRVLVTFLVCTGAIAAIYGLSRLAAEIMDAREGRPAYTSGSTEPSSTESASQGSEPAPPMKVPGVFSEYSEKAEKKLSQMTLEEKIGQIFIFRAPESGQAELVQKYRPAGLCLMGNSFQGKTVWQVQQMTSSAQAASAIPLALCCDEEGGTVVRVSSNPALADKRFASPQEVFASGGMGAIRQDTQKKSRLLKSLGVNMNLAPVCDVSTDTTDFVNARSFGKSASETAEFIRASVEVYQSEGISAVLKHFPGYGNNADTHTGIVYDKRNYQTFQTSDFLPFQAGIDAGAPVVLVSHNIVSCMDGIRPASLSPKVCSVLREELGFTGIIMTDDLCMGAVKEFNNGKSVAKMAFLAGNDILLSTDAEEDYQAIVSAVKDGSISMERLEESVLRVLAWKYKMGILTE